MRSSTPLRARLERISRAAFGIVATLGAAAIWGWVLGVPPLRDLGADFAPMSPSAALALVLLATSFFAAERGRRKSSAAAAGLAALIALLTLVESLTGLPLGMSFAWMAPPGGEMPNARVPRGNGVASARSSSVTAAAGAVRTLSESAK